MKRVVMAFGGDLSGSVQWAAQSDRTAVKFDPLRWLTVEVELCPNRSATPAAVGSGQQASTTCEGQGKGYLIKSTGSYC